MEGGRERERHRDTQKQEGETEKQTERERDREEREGKGPLPCTGSRWGLRTAGPPGGLAGQFRNPDVCSLLSRFHPGL